MDKISGIIPASKRVTTVDFQKEFPMRPGVPSFGRPMGRSTHAPLPKTDEMKVSQTARNLNKVKPPTQVDLEAQRAASVDRLASDFFMYKPTDAARPSQNMKQATPRGVIEEADVERDPIDPEQENFVQTAYGYGSATESDQNLDVRA